MCDVYRLQQRLYLRHPHHGAMDDEPMVPFEEEHSRSVSNARCIVHMGSKLK